MLTLPGVAYTVTHGKRFRIADSDISVHGSQEVLNSWWAVNGVRDASGLLHHAMKTWPSRGTPSPEELIGSAPYTLAVEMVQVDQSLHPRHSRIVAALIAEHGSKTCMITPRRIEFEAMEVARTILRVFSKYREIAKDYVKKAAVLRKCTVEQRNRIQRLLDQITAPVPDPDGVVARISGVARSNGDAVRNNSIGGDGGDGGGELAFAFDIDGLASDLGHSIHGAQHSVCYDGGLSEY